MSRLDVHFGFDHQFLRARSGVRVKLRARKVGLPERSMSTPVNKVMKRETFVLLVGPHLSLNKSYQLDTSKTKANELLKLSARERYAFISYREGITYG